MMTHTNRDSQGKNKTRPVAAAVTVTLGGFSAHPVGISSTALVVSRKVSGCKVHQCNTLIGDKAMT